MKRKKKPEKREKSLDDQFCDYVRGECVKEVVRYLKASVNVGRPIGSLKKHELEGIAEAVTATWIGLQAERLQRTTPSEKDRKLRWLILGV